MPLLVVDSRSDFGVSEVALPMVGCCGCSRDASRLHSLAIEVFCCRSCSHLFTLPAAPLWSWRFLKVPMGSWVLLEVHTMNFIEISDHWQISKNQRCLFLFSDLPAEQQNEWSSLIAPCLHTWTLDRQIYFSVCSSGRSFRRSSSQVMKTRSNSVI